MSLEGLLPFHHNILEEIHDPSKSQLVLLARGLGLRKIVCTLMQIYDQSTNLVLLVNASSDEEAAIGEELGIMGCRRPGLRAVDHEMGKKDRWVTSFMLCRVSVTPKCPNGIDFCIDAVLCADSDTPIRPPERLCI